MDVLEHGQAGVLLEAVAEPDGALGSDLVALQTAKRHKIDNIKNIRKVKVAYRGRLIERGGLGWFERTYSSVVSVVLISRPLPSPMAPLGPILFHFKLRKHARLMASKTLEK